MGSTELQAKLRAPEPAMRRAALEEVSELAKKREASPDLLPDLTALLADPVDDVRQAASTAIGWLAYRQEVADPTLLGPATRLLQDPVGMIRHDGAWILESLAQRGVADGQALPWLIRNVEHDNQDTRAAAAFAICELAKAGHTDRSAIGPLKRQASVAQDPTEKRAAESALAALSNVSLPD